MRDAAAAATALVGSSIWDAADYVLRRYAGESVPAAEEELASWCADGHYRDWDRLDLAGERAVNVMFCLKYSTPAGRATMFNYHNLTNGAEGGTDDIRQLAQRPCSCHSIDGQFKDSEHVFTGDAAFIAAAYPQANALYQLASMDDMVQQLADEVRSFHCRASVRRLADYGLYPKFHKMPSQNSSEFIELLARYKSRRSAQNQQLTTVIRTLDFKRLYTKVDQTDLKHTMDWWLQEVWALHPGKPYLQASSERGSEPRWLEHPEDSGSHQPDGQLFTFTLSSIQEMSHFIVDNAFIRVGTQRSARAVAILLTFQSTARFLDDVGSLNNPPIDDRYGMGDGWAHYTYIKQQDELGFSGGYQLYTHISA
ncbi:hypothetical protein WJX72_004565 [[Myrmecia] bisecta]|uniref:Uncharacterized protein n=1 Tax=[Myrmecia] bisecta TaxID=41462 RepID=A0AAW1PS71_9CHLO